MSVLQIVGTLLAIPVGIGSAYSMYRANFSVETACQSLRANIVAMLDKNVDAGTRHMLARRDVEAFERSCGGVDPDATAAFKALLAADKGPATPAQAATAAVRRIEPKPEAVARKAEPRPEVVAKQPPANIPAPVAEAAPVQREASSDAVWVAAVRRALIAHAPDPAPSIDAAMASAAPRTLPAAPALAPTSAPALPPPTSVANVSAPPADADHPVPPASIPEATFAPKNANAAIDGHSRSRIDDLVAQVPLLGKTLKAIDSGLH